MTNEMLEELGRRSTVPPSSALAQGPRRSAPPQRVAYAPPGVEAGRPSALTVPSAPMPRSGPRTSGVRIPPLFPATPEAAPIHRLPSTFGAQGPRAQASSFLDLGAEGLGRFRPTRAGIATLLAFAAVFIAVVLVLRVGVLRALRQSPPPIVVAAPLAPGEVPSKSLGAAPEPTPAPSATTAPTASAASKSHHHRRHRKVEVAPVEEEEEEDETPSTLRAAANSAMNAPSNFDDVDAAARIQELARDQLENSLK